MKIEQIERQILEREASLQHITSELAWLRLLEKGARIQAKAGESTPEDALEEMEKPIAETNWKRLARTLLVLLANK